MLKKFFEKEDSVLEDEIKRIRTRMLKVDPNSEEYNQLLASFERLVRLQSEDKGSRISKDTMLIVAGNLIGILIIVSYERSHVIASRGLQFLFKTKHQS